MNWKNGRRAGKLRVIMLTAFVGGLLFMMTARSDSIAGQGTNAAAGHMNQTGPLRAVAGQQTAIPILFTNINVLVWGKGRGKEQEVVNLPIRAKIKITASELKEGAGTANRTNREWVLTTTVTLARISSAKRVWNAAAKTTYDIANPPYADGWIYPNFLWLMTGCAEYGGVGAWNDYGVVWVDNGAEVDGACHSTREWHGIMDESRYDANITVDMIESGPVDVVIKSGPNKGTAKIFIFYADFSTYFKREIPKLPPPWGLYLLRWELSGDGELTLYAPIEAGGVETIPENYGEAFK